MNDTKPFGVEITLSDVCKNITYGYTASATSENTGVKFLRITDIVPSRIDWESVPFCKISPSDLDKYQIREGDIVIARTGATTGYNKTIKQLPYPAVYASYLIKYDLDRYKADSAFVGYVLQASNWYEYVDAIAGGSAQPGANAKQLGSYTFILPALPEQKAIASVLSSLDDKIDLLHRQNKTLEAMAETLFRQWFIEEAKEDWEKGELCKLITIFSGYPFKSSSFTDNGKYKLITIKAVQDGYLELSNADEINELPDRLPNYCFLEKGDILLSLTGNVGRCCLVDRNLLLLNQRVAKLFPKSSRDLAFTYFMFRQGSMKAVLEEMAKGTAQANLSPIETAKLEILLPPEPLLEKFSKVATPLLNKILENKVSIRTLEKLRDTLLPKLMSGEVRVQFKQESAA